MTRRILISRRDWMQDAAASFDPSVGFWSPAKPLTNLLDMNPQLAAEAVDNRDTASTQFVVDLGDLRPIGLIAFVGLRASAFGLLRVQAGVDPTFVTNLYDSGVVPTWPVDSAAGGLDGWGRWTLNGIYAEDEYTARGMPRVLIPSSENWMRYIKVAIRDTVARDPLTIGCFGAYQVFEPTFNFDYKWELTPVDDSVVTRVPRGSSFIDKRGIREKLNLGFPSMPEEEVWARAFGMMLAKGKSEPFWVVPFSDTTQITRFEKAAVYGLVSQDSVLSNPYFGRYALPVQIEQLY
jgi:hypothetical protein